MIFRRKHLLGLEDLSREEILHILDTARTFGMPLPMSALNLQLYESMLQMGMGSLDNSAVIGVFEAMGATTLLES